MIMQCHSAYVKGIDPQSPDFIDKLEILDQYIDDFLDASKHKDISTSRSDIQMNLLEQSNTSFKPRSIEKGAP
jgi:hypothetical protein